MVPFYEDEDSAADIAVVGLGPGGLAAALSAAKRGLQVIAFTDRSEYIRGQRIYLKGPAVSILQEHRIPGDEEDNTFWELHETRSLQIKDVERYLHRKLTTYPNVTIIPIDKTTEHIAAVKPGEDGAADFMELSTGKKYYFHHLLAADGGRGGLTEAMVTAERHTAGYSPTPVQMEHPYHAAVQLTLKEGAEISTPTTTFIDQMKARDDLGWHEPRQPKGYVFTNPLGTKFSFAGEIPKEIFEAPKDEQKKLLKQWAALLIAETYGINADELDYRASRKTPAKDALQANTFEIRELKKSQEPVIPLTAGVMATIGDARRTPNYLLGHGLNDAIFLGDTFSYGVKGHTFDEKDYLELIEEIDTILDDFMASQQTEVIRRTEKAREVLLKDIDALINALESAHKTPESIAALQAARTAFTEENNMTTLYHALDLIEPILKQHPSEALSDDTFAYTSAHLEAKAAETRALGLVESIKENIETYTLRPL